MPCVGSVDGVYATCIKKVELRACFGMLYVVHFLSEVPTVIICKQGASSLCFQIQRHFKFPAVAHDQRVLQVVPVVLNLEASLCALACLWLGGLQ
jgi:hypothetical protein